MIPNFMACALVNDIDVGLAIDYKLHDFKLLIYCTNEPMWVCDGTLTNPSFVGVGFVNGYISNVLCVGRSNPKFGCPIKLPPKVAQELAMMDNI